LKHFEVGLGEAVKDIEQKRLQAVEYPTDVSHSHLESATNANQAKWLTPVLTEARSC